MSRLVYKLGVFLFVVIGFLLILYVANGQIAYANDGLGLLDLLF